MNEQNALKVIAEKLRRAGATLPAPEPAGTIESAMATGLSIALCLVEEEARALAAAPQQAAPPLACVPTEAQISRHTLTAKECPPDSKVLLVSSVRRMQEASAPLKVWTSLPGPDLWIRDGAFKSHGPHPGAGPWFTMDTVLRLFTVEHERFAALQAEADRFRSAWTEWNDKTEWLQDLFNAGNLPARVAGLHRADVIREAFKELQAKAASLPNCAASWNAEAELRSAWDEINAAIEPGDLPGDGTDRTAQRNGLILAANMLSARIMRLTATQQPADPMDWPLPCDVTIGAGTHRKGTSLGTLVRRAQRLWEEAYGPMPSPEDQAANLAQLQAPALVLQPAAAREEVLRQMLELLQDFVDAARTPDDNDKKHIRRRQLAEKYGRLVEDEGGRRWTNIYARMVERAKELLAAGEAN